MQAQFRADLRKPGGPGRTGITTGRSGTGGTGSTTKRVVLQAPGLENRPRLSDLLLGEAEKKADSILAQLRRSREQQMARSKAVARADAVRREKIKEFEERKPVPVPAEAGWSRQNRRRRPFQKRRGSISIR